MPNYIEQIDKLAAVIGCPVNFADQVPIKTLKDEIAHLISSNSDKRKAICHINDEIEKIKAQISAMRDEDAGVKEEMEANHKRTDILKNYMDTIESSDTFLPNKLTREIEDHITFIYEPMMELHERRSEIKRQLAALSEIQDECDKVRKEAGI